MRSVHVNVRGKAPGYEIRDEAPQHESMPGIDEA